MSGLPLGGFLTNGLASLLWQLCGPVVVGGRDSALCIHFCPSASPGLCPGVSTGPIHPSASSIKPAYPTPPTPLTPHRILGKAHNRKTAFWRWHEPWLCVPHPAPTVPSLGHCPGGTLAQPCLSRAFFGLSLADSRYHSGSLIMLVPLLTEHVSPSA